MRAFEDCLRPSRGGDGLRKAIAALAAGCLLGALAACGGSSTSSETSRPPTPDNGIASKSPEAILAAATNGIDGARSVHVSGSDNDTTLHLYLSAGKGSRGEISERGLKYQIVSIGNVLYVKASDAAWREAGGEAAVQLLHDKWLKASLKSGDFASFAPLTNAPRLFRELVSVHGTLRKDGTTAINGQKAIALRDPSGGTVYVATTGTPVPLEVVEGGAHGARILFDHFNAPVSLAAPSNAIDYSLLQSK